MARKKKVGAEKAWQLSQSNTTKGHILEPDCDSLLSMAKEHGWAKNEGDMPNPGGKSIENKRQAANVQASLWCFLTEEACQPRRTSSSAPFAQYECSPWLQRCLREGKYCKVLFRDNLRWIFTLLAECRWPV